MTWLALAIVLLIPAVGQAQYGGFFSGPDPLMLQLVERQSRLDHQAETEERLVTLEQKVKHNQNLAEMNRMLDDLMEVTTPGSPKFDPKRRQ